VDANKCAGHYYNLSKSERLWFLSNQMQNPEQSVQFETIYLAKIRGWYRFLTVGGISLVRR
jgi:gamma-glutamylcysteine synthetase